ncbi:MAG: hypothetical protein ACOH1H_11225 [Brevundimonas sp.]
MLKWLGLLAVLAGTLPPSSVADGTRRLAATGCPAFRNIDQPRLPTRVNNDPQQPPLVDVWSSWAADTPEIPQPDADPDSTIRLSTVQMMTSEPVEQAIAARHSAAGWEVFARARSMAGPSGPWSPWRPLTLSTDAATRLSAVLDDPCLWSAPRFLPSEVPLLNGRYEARYDGPNTFYAVSSADRHWGGWHISWSLGAPGRIRAILMSQAFGGPEEVDEDIGPDGWLAAPP